jgi:hypothetical protein
MDDYINLKNRGVGLKIIRKSVQRKFGQLVKCFEQDGSRTQISGFRIL